MRVAVILVWRPKGFPAWHGRMRPGGEEVPAALAFDRSAAPYGGTHIASLLPRSWDVRLVHEMVRDVDLDMDVDAVFLSTMDFCAPHARWLARAFRDGPEYEGRSGPARGALALLFRVPALPNG